MEIRRWLVGAAVLASSVTLLAGPASAAPKAKSTSAKVVGTVKIDPSDPSVAWVLAQYTCTIADPENHPGHLWVSVKQNDAGTVDSEVQGEGSGFGGIAARWEDSHRNEVNCDGKNHVDRFRVDQIEDKSAWKTLTKGYGWVQFCLFDDTTPGEIPVSSMVWAHVG
jgi:hypothetical protein